MNLLDDSLSADLVRNVALTLAVTEQFWILSRYAVGMGAAAILFTCSAFGPCIEAVGRDVPAVPVSMPNAAMIAEAAAPDGRVGLLTRFAGSLATMAAEFPPGFGIRTQLVEGALAALNRGDGAAHDRLTAEAARTLVLEGDGFEVFALAQFSLAQAASAVAAATGRRVLTTPYSTVLRLKAMLV